jgi:hypothetical protein
MTRSLTAVVVSMVVAGTTVVAPALSQSPDYYGLRGQPRLTANTSPKKVRPGKKRGLTTHGTLVLPSDVTPEQGCNGNVRVTIKQGKKTVSRHTAQVGSDCKYRSKAKVRVGSKKPLKVSARFRGNASLLPASARTQKVRLKAKKGRGRPRKVGAR